MIRKDPGRWQLRDDDTPVSQTGAAFRSGQTMTDLIKNFNGLRSGTSRLPRPWVHWEVDRVESPRPNLRDGGVPREEPSHTNVPKLR